MNSSRRIILVTLALLGAISSFSAILSANTSSSTASASEQTSDKGLDIAIFAGGCFWCVESDFDKIEGVVETTSGYTGGHTQNPDYKQVTRGNTGHIEAVEIKFDPAIVTYEALLTHFWHTVDPLDAGGQFCDRGESYQTTIFATTPEQKQLALASKKAIDESGVLAAPIVTPVRDAKHFYPAETYHQDYYQKNPVRYKFYRFNCGRDKRVAEVWSQK